MLESADSPNFTQPFITRFTDLFVAAGSAYLVEPLPVGINLSEAWRHVLLSRPHQAQAITAILTRHLLPLVRQLNAIRRAEPALQRFENLRLLGTHGEHVFAYAKGTEIAVAVNLDPRAPREPEPRRVVR